MEDVHEIFTRFKKDFPKIYAAYEALGQEIHERSGPLDERVRWLLKIAVSAASGHTVALETHIKKGKEAGLNDGEIMHALLMLIQTVGFPRFMGAYRVFKELR